MSTANFWTMDKFPLYTKENPIVEFWKCKTCGHREYEEDKPEDCAICKFPNFVQEEEYDEDEARYEYDAIEKEFGEFNNELKFHKVEVKSGYYEGTQFYVKEERGIRDYDDEEDTKEFNEEVDKINEYLKQKAEEWGYEALRCIGVFSNGEAVYEKVK